MLGRLLKIPRAQCGCVCLITRVSTHDEPCTLFLSIRDVHLLDRSSLTRAVSHIERLNAWRGLSPNI